MAGEESEAKFANLNKPKLGFFWITMLALFVSIVSSIGVVAVYDQKYAAKIVTMDLKGYIRNQRDKAVNGEITGEQLRKRIDEMEAVFLTVPDNYTVIMKEVVLRNGREIKL